MSELARQMEARGISNPWSLTEFDQWVNEATRKDIETLAERHGFKVFGLKMWTWEKIHGKDLVGALNFSVDLIFKNEDEAEVDRLIRGYMEQTKRNWNMKADKKLVDKLFTLALHSCTWV